MNIALRDHKIYQMKLELENRKRILCNKKRLLERNSRENNYLKEVLDDYNKYNTHIVEQKEKQIIHLHMLNQYINSIAKDLKLTDTQLKYSQQEQREIMREIRNVKREMDDIVNNQ